MAIVLVLQLGKLRPRTSQVIAGEGSELGFELRVVNSEAHACLSRPQVANRFPFVILPQFVS